MTVGFRALVPMATQTSKGGLRTEAVELERRQQTDDAIGNKGRGRRKAVVLGRLESGGSVKAARNLPELTGSDQSLNRRTRGTAGHEIPRPGEPAGNLSRLGWGTLRSLITFRRHLFASADVTLHADEPDSSPI